MPSTLMQLSRNSAFGRLIEMYILDLTKNGGDVFFFHNSDNATGGEITFQGNTYVPRAIKSEGWEWNTRGVLPRPTVTVGNIDSDITALMRLYDDFVGCLVTRKRTYEAFLDGQPTADPTQEFPPDIFEVERRVTETNSIVTFELATKMDREGLLLPRRQIIAGSCIWTLFGVDCGYTGAPKQWGANGVFGALVDRGAYNPATTYNHFDYVYTVAVTGVQVKWVSRVATNNFPLSDDTKWAMALCRKGLDDCKAHFGVNSPLSTSAFPGCNRVPG